MTKMTTTLPAPQTGWMIQTQDGRRTRYATTSQQIAFHYARQHQAEWCRPYTVVDGTTFVEV